MATKHRRRCGARSSENSERQRQKNIYSKTGPKISFDLFKILFEIVASAHHSQIVQQKAQRVKGNLLQTSYERF